MAKLFGEYLIEAGIVSGDAVLAALIEQLRELPSLAELIYDRRFLPSDAIFKILSHQQRSGLDFRASATHLGYWNEALSAQVELALRSVRRPIGEILVDQGCMGIGTLSAVLGSYVDAATNGKLEVSSSPLVPARTVGSAASTATTATHAASTVSAAPSPTPQERATLGSTLDPVLTREYCKLFQGRIRPNLNACAQTIDDTLIGSDSLRQALRTAAAEFAAAAAAAGFFAAKDSGRISQAAQELLLRLLSSKAPIAGTEQALALSVIKLAGDLLDGISQYLAEFHSEELFHADTNLRDIAGRLDLAIATLQLKVTPNAA